MRSASVRHHSSCVIARAAGPWQSVPPVGADIIRPQKRLRQEQEARTHEAYERIVLGKKTRSSYGSSSGSSYSSGKSSLDSYLENRYNRGELGTASATACCDNCRYYSGGVCTNSNSHAHNQTIFNPYHSSCGWHS